MKRILALLTSFSIVALSCKKLISIPAAPPTEISQTHVFSDSTDIMGAIAGVYANFGASSYGAVFGNGAITENTALSSDETTNTGFSSTPNQFYEDALAVDNGTVQSMWTNAYSAIYQMNACITGIQSTTAISDPLKQQLIGEMRVCRALYYFNLVNLFGTVPIVTSTDYNVTAIEPRSSVDSVYAFVKSDLLQAMSGLTATYPSAGAARPNLYTAEALLARIYLYKEQWDSAAYMAGQVTGSGLYSLVSDPNAVFLDGSTEAIWQLPANGLLYQTSEAVNFIPYSNTATPTNSITSSLMNAFEPGDLREADWTDSSVVLNYATGMTTAYYYPYKYKNRSNSAATTEDYMILRLAEQYLILAEALAEQNQPGQALTYLNMVRTRAGLGQSTAITQAQVLSAIIRERRVEFFCEWGNRWYDLKRTGTIDSVMNAAKPGIWQSYAALYPIPLSELQNNPALIQNTGY